MKKNLVLVLAFPIFSLCLVHSHEKQTNQTPTPYTYDFGEIKEGDSPKHTFNYTNDTGSPIKIIKVRVPCGCAETKVDKKNLAPGEKTKFDIQLDSKGRRGKLKKALYLLTDNKKKPIIKYIIKADIKPKPAPVCFSPSVVKAGKVAPKEAKDVAFEIENKGTLDLVLNKGTAAPAVKVKTALPITIKAGKKQKIDLNVTAPFYEGKFRGNLMFKTNDPTKPKLWILVTADVAK